MTKTDNNNMPLELSDASEDEMPTLTPGEIRLTAPTNRKCSKQSRRRLEELKFDPLEELVILAKKVDAELVQMRFNSDGSYKEKYSAMAYGQLLATKQKLLNDLMRYGYARVPETNVLETPKIATGLTINLSKKGDTFMDASFDMKERTESDGFKDEDYLDDNTDSNYNNEMTIRINK